MYSHCIVYMYYRRLAGIELVLCLLCTCIVCNVYFTRTVRCTCCLPACYCVLLISCSVMLQLSLVSSLLSCCLLCCLLCRIGNLKSHKNNHYNKVDTDHYMTISYCYRLTVCQIESKLK